MLQMVRSWHHELKDSQDMRLPSGVGAPRVEDKGRKMVSEYFAIIEKHTLLHPWACFTLDIEWLFCDPTKLSHLAVICVLFQNLCFRVKGFLEKLPPSFPAANIRPVTSVCHPSLASLVIIAAQFCVEKKWGDGELCLVTYFSMTEMSSLLPGHLANHQDFISSICFRVRLYIESFPLYVLKL